MTKPIHIIGREIMEGLFTPSYTQPQKNVIEKLTRRLSFQSKPPRYDSWKHDDMLQIAKDHGLIAKQAEQCISQAVKDTEAKRYGTKETGFTYRKAMECTESIETFEEFVINEEQIDEDFFGEEYATIDAARNKKKRLDEVHPTTQHTIIRGRQSGKYFVVRTHSGMEHVAESALTEAEGYRKVILVKSSGNAPGHDKIHVVERPDGGYHVVAKHHTNNDVNNSSKSGSNQHLANFGPNRHGEGNKATAQRIEKALIDAHKTKNPENVLKAMKEHGYAHHDWRIHKDLNEGSGAGVDAEDAERKVDGADKAGSKSRDRKPQQDHKIRNAIIAARTPGPTTDYSAGLGGFMGAATVQSEESESFEDTYLQGIREDQENDREHSRHEYQKATQQNKEKAAHLKRLVRKHHHE